MSETKSYKRFVKKQNDAEIVGRVVLAYLGLLLMLWGIATGIATVILFPYFVYTAFVYREFDDPSVTFGRTVSNICFVALACGASSLLCIWVWKRIESYTGPILDVIFFKTKQSAQWQPAKTLATTETELRIRSAGQEIAVEDTATPEE